MPGALSHAPPPGRGHRAVGSEHAAERPPPRRRGRRHPHWIAFFAALLAGISSRACGSCSTAATRSSRPTMSAWAPTAPTRTSSATPEGFVTPVGPRAVSSRGRHWEHAEDPRVLLLLVIESDGAFRGGSGAHRRTERAEPRAQRGAPQRAHGAVGAADALVQGRQRRRGCGRRATPEPTATSAPSWSASTTRARISVS